MSDERPYRIDFFRYRIPWLVISLMLITSGIIEIKTNGLRYSVDFTGGILVQMHFADDVKVKDVRSSLNKVHLGDSLIQEFGSHKDILVRVAQEKAEKLAGTTQAGKVSVESMLEHLSLTISKAIRSSFMKKATHEERADLNNTGLIQLDHTLKEGNPLGLDRDKTPIQVDRKYHDLAKAIYDARMAEGGVVTSWKVLFSKTSLPVKLRKYLQSSFYLGPFTIMQTEFVGPQVGRELKEKTRLAIIFALIGMLIYIWIRFDLLFGVAAVICLAHDFLVTLSAFALTHREISLTVVAAFLTIIGYSLNDTIVVYDRIRENVGKRRYRDLITLYNASMNEVLSRTLLTSLTTLFVVIILFVFGGEVINNFAFALLVGIVVGTYSSIYVASSLASYWQEFRRKKKAVAPGKGKRNRKGARSKA